MVELLTLLVITFVLVMKRQPFHVLVLVKKMKTLKKMKMVNQQKLYQPIQS